MRLRRTTALLALAGCTALSGCQFKGAAAIPLPGGEGGGKDAYKVTIEFPDVLDLVPQSAVKVGLERLGADGLWQPVDGTEVTLDARDDAEHRWDVEPGRYRAVLQRLDADGDPAGKPLLSDEVTVADVSGAPTP